MPNTYSLKQNAVRAARKAIADGTALAPTYEIKGAKGGFRIVWDAEPPPAAAPGVETTPALDPKSPNPVEQFMARGVAAQQAVDAAIKKAAPAKAGSRLAKVTELLQRPEGATIAEIQAVTGWLPHTTRAFISVQIRRKAGLEVTTDKVEGRGRVYRVAS